MRDQIVPFIPSFMKPLLRKMYYLPLDLVDNLKGRDSMIPPRSMIFIGQGDFVQIGQEFKRYFIELADLKPNGRVLDVGCGIGRMTIPLTDYLSKEGEYWGFDIVQKGIDWCNGHISPKFSNFHFLHSDVYNKHYNPNGKILAQNYQFPFDNDTFDLIILTSVFTHMFPADVENYLSEISRVLKTGGKCLITFFILNKESIDLVKSGQSTLDFKYMVDGCLTINKKDPENAIAYDEQCIKDMFEKYSLRITQPIHYGSWCNRKTHLTYQDLIIATK
jgi:ubiquinone/menaquinone biosynthesis C-methylase UbiE